MYLHLHNYLTVFYSNMSNKHKHEQSQMNTNEWGQSFTQRFKDI